MIKRFFFVIGIVLISILAIVALTTFGLGMKATFGPIERDIDRSINTHSNSFVQSTNIQLSNMIIAYNALEAQGNREADETGFVSPSTVQQEHAMIQTMCEIVATMPQGTVAPNVAAFLSEKGTCR